MYFMKNKESKIVLPDVVVPSFTVYINPVEGEMPLMAIGTPGGATVFDYNTLFRMKECGMNIAENTLRVSSIETSLLNAQSAKMKIMVRLPMPSFAIYKTVEKEIDGEKKKVDEPIVNNLPFVNPNDSKWTDFYNDWENVVATYGSNSSVAGWMVKDEPQIKDFWVVAECIKRIYTKVMENEDNSSQMFVFNNMLKVKLLSENTTSDLLYLTGGMGEKYFVTIKGEMTEVISHEDILSHFEGYSAITSYKEYLRLFWKLTHTPMFSVDAYPFSGETYSFNKQKSVWEKNVYDTNNNLKRNIEAYFKTLTEYNTQTRPFWSTVPTTQECYKKTSTGNDGKSVSIWEDRLQIPSLASLRYQAFSSLAFGACGLSFWRFSDEIHEDSGIKWINSPLGIDGNKTPLFDAVKTVVSQIKKFQNIFLNSKEVTPIFLKPLNESTIGNNLSSEDFIPRAYNTPGVKTLIVDNNGILCDYGIIDENDGEIVVRKLQRDDDKYSEYNRLIGDGGVRENNKEEIRTITFSFLKAIKAPSDYGCLISRLLTDDKEYLIVLNLDYVDIQPVHIEFTDFVRDESSETAIVKQLTFKMQPGDWRIFSRKL